LGEIKSLGISTRDDAKDDTIASGEARKKTTTKKNNRSPHGRRRGYNGVLKPKKRRPTPPTRRHQKGSVATVRRPRCRGGQVILPGKEGKKKTSLSRK